MGNVRLSDNLLSRPLSNGFSDFKPSSFISNSFCITILFLFFLLSIGNSFVFGMQPKADFSEISHTADIIFVGTVNDVSCKRLAGSNNVLTYVTFKQIYLIDRKAHVSEDVKDKITLTFGGGRADGAAVSYSGVPKFEIGQRCLIFALYDGRRYTNPLVGGIQGLFRLTTDAQTGKSYPLASGKAGIISLNNGKLKKLSRVDKINNGQIQRLPRRKPLMAAPHSKSKSSIARTAKEPPLPKKILSLEEFITNIHSTLAAGPPSNPVFRIKGRGKVLHDNYPVTEKNPKASDNAPAANLARKGLVPSGQIPPGRDDPTFPIDRITNDSSPYPTESNDSQAPLAMGDGIAFGWCGYLDLPGVFEQYDASWSPWYEINSNSMWLYNQFMGIY